MKYLYEDGTAQLQLLTVNLGRADSGS